MFLRFTKYEIRYKISCVVWTNKASFFGANTGMTAFAVIYCFPHLWLFVTITNRIRTIQEIILSRFFVKVTSFSPILIYNSWFIREIPIQVMLCSKRVLNDKSQPFYVTHIKHFKQCCIKEIPFICSFYYNVVNIFFW